MNFAMATLVLKEMGKFLWKGRGKVCLVGCLSDSQLEKLFSISFKTKVAIA